MGRVIFGIPNRNRCVAGPSGSPSDREEGADGGAVFGDGASGVPPLPSRDELEGDEPLRTGVHSRGPVSLLGGARRC